MKVFERSNFFTGKLLTAEDLNAEQQYQIDKRRLHNRLLHGWGVVSGLQVTSNKTGDGIRVGSGVALDCQGNEIIVPTPVDIKIVTKDEALRSLYVVVIYEERLVRPVPVNTGDADETVGNQISESFVVSTEVANCNAKHRHFRGRWIACGERHAIALARLRKVTKGWRVDRRYRVPQVR